MHSSPKPLVLLPACERWLDGKPLQTVRQQYLEALEAVGLQPLIVPTSIAPDWNADGAVCVRQDQPVPLTVLSMALEVSVGG